MSSHPSYEIDPYGQLSIDSIKDSRYGTALHPLSGINNYYDIVDNRCSLEPYVDKLYWTIDGLSPY